MLRALVLALALGSADRPLQVVVSLPPQLWLVESIGGRRVSAVALVGPNDSEETFAPTDAQVSATLRASVYFRIGAPFEEAPWFRALAAARNLEIVEARAGVELLTTSGAPDPHVWLSPRRLVAQARTVAATLGRLDPAGRQLYEQRLRDVILELESLDRELAEILGPYRGRSFYVFHPSWGYLASDYGLRQVAIETDGKEPTDRELTVLQEQARAERVRFLFVQPQIAGRGAAAVASAVGATLVRIDPLAGDVTANLRRVALQLAASFSP